jgi:hypothetical protein
MVQVDIFWSYGLASGLALAASKHLKKEKNPWKNEYFVLTLLWVAILFAPSGMYLLWEFPSWETMFVARGHADIPGWLVALFGATNITQGVLGFYVTWRLLRSGKELAAKMQTVWSHVAMLLVLAVGWDGTAWKRFTYSGTGQDWAAGVELPWTGFFTSPVFYTLLGMSVFFVPSYVYLCLRWRGEQQAHSGTLNQKMEMSPS